MQAQELIQWAVYTGIACVIFTSITGLRLRFWRSAKSCELTALRLQVQQLELEIRQLKQTSGQTH